MLSPELVRQVKRIQFMTGRHVADVLAGAYLSVFRGRGIEFDEVRPYVPGDDIRTIDWNVTARVGAPYVKRYMEERQLTVLLLVDISASQDFGSAERSKREAAAELSALIAFSAIENDDKVGLLLFHREAELYIPPRKGQKHALRVIREVLAPGDRGQKEHDVEAQAELGALPSRVRRWFARLRQLRRGTPTRSTSIRHALEFARRVLPRRAVLFLISDFFDKDYMGALRTANRRHDVVAVQVSDQRENATSGVGLVTLEDAETGQLRVVDTDSAAFRSMLGATAAQRASGLETELRSAGIDLVRIDAHRSVVDPLLAFFRMRQKRLRR
jgi:uncharacterized protein (DUF58 family)